ncbi:alkaline phosphatase family protein [Haliangium ochraceum]|uniref:Type I phosphodiesterase/nucleotide pyrophosphatase n=1 Tax=Haliangium ochraceum (strain DSM 14365 / JCM 11303 / SMP-2) TaxID=502025 RepID=D0LJF6_HALO1|nr:alkaline phosphatase family protein [Haliangium ochraceum]ACY16530.1 hypothetical protein Hoch_4031 [Haliangium ochraceum DSM 14365]
MGTAAPGRSSLSPRRALLARALLARALWALALLALAAGVFELRRGFIRSFFVRGPGGAAAPALALPEDADALPTTPPVERLRVVLLDGVDRATAERLPNYNALCARGLDLVVDVGFPTVSLPVQAALWSGRTQQQSGIEFVGELLAEPLADSVPARVPGSAAVAEYYPFIARSSGFEAVQPADELDGEARAAWQAEGFLPAATAAMASGARLAFVHLLRADTAGHKHGRLSEQFERAAAEADAMLGALLVAAAKPRPGGGVRWLILADHGHRGGGGHGGAEPAIRLVRACVAPTPVTLPPGWSDGAAAVLAEIGAGDDRSGRARGFVHLVDVARLIADSLAVALPEDSAGRPLAAALAAPPGLGATLPRPGVVASALAALVMLAALAATLWLVFAGPGAGPESARWPMLPLWWPLACVSVLLFAELPTLSVPMVYKPWSGELALAALPGWLLLALTGFWALARVGAARATAALLLLPMAACLAAALLCWGRPPLMPGASAQLSAALTVLAYALVVLASAHLARAVRDGFGRSRPAEAGP